MGRGPWGAAVLALAAAAALGGLFVTFVARPLRVDGASMDPALRDGDVVATLVAPAAVRLVGVGDLVVARRPGGPGDDPDGALVVKRVVGIAEGPRGAAYELAGDNPSRSADSRHFGPVTAGSIEGLVIFRVYPRPFRIGRGPREDSREPH